MKFQRPGVDEYAPYYGRYISLVPEGDFLLILTNQFESTISLLKSFGPDKADYSYAPDKWTIKQLVQHMIDAERIFAYRILRISRGDTTPIPGFNEDDYAASARVDHRTLKELITEWTNVRVTTLDLLRSLNAEETARMGTASDAPVSVRALAYTIAGHELHHRQVLRERYL